MWVFRPDGHKTAHRGKTRAVAIGPRAQAVLAELTPPDPSDYYVCPRRADEAGQAAARGTKRWPSHARQDRDKQVATRARGAHYVTGSYAHAVAQACRKAEVAVWAPNQLRHTVGTEFRRSVLSSRLTGIHDNQLRHTVGTEFRRQFG